MLRFVAVIVLLLGALSTLTAASAYQVARPTNGMVVTVSSSENAQIAISPGSNDASFGWVQGAGTGTVSLDLTRGPGGATGYTFSTNATYTAYRVVRITNRSKYDQSVIVNHGSGQVPVESGFVYPGGSEVAGTTFTLSANGGYVELNLKIQTLSSGATLQYEITATKLN